MICRVCDIGPGAYRIGRLLAQTANLMVGIPDYDTYLEHRRALHPTEPVMTRDEFFRERQESRYGGKGRAFRCC
jgi:uncharacterized short protein YbdD (DUF466 family)